ncbi:MAG: VPS10 domain-containing protein [Candidatus Acidiferrales bacterium]
MKRLSIFLFTCLLPVSLCGATLIRAQKKNAAKKSEAAQKRESGEAAPSEAGKPSETGKPAEPPLEKALAGLELRSIGPALIAGRIVSIAVDPENRAHYFIGAASGNVWKTENDGASWTPVFEHEGSYSIGSVTLDPKNPAVVWVGTGENNSQRSVSYGDGVYRSDDGGKSWKNLGLKNSEHIARIAIDPRDSNIVYVAAQGPLWGSGGDRGLFKTTDGGKTWKNILSISEHTGVSDLVMSPDNPDTLYATAYQRERKTWTLIDGGPESAIYKSTDAGATWTKLKSGLPTVDMGRIGLAVSATNPNVVYATVEAAEHKGGIFRSADRGATWDRRNEYDAGAMYYATVFVDPKNEDRIYVMGVNIQVSDDGGHTLHSLGTKSKHVDNHVIWIDPHDTNYYLVGCDGGVYESFDRGENWIFKSNLPLGQFYDVAVDRAAPFYHVYGGTQDNSSVGGPSRTRSASGIVNTDWFFTHGGDGFKSQADPEDPNTVYAELQNGNLVRDDRATGERMGIVPQEGPGEPPLRWNWDSPFIISPHSHTRIYFAANILFRSDDRGNSWRAISGDLSRQIDRNSLLVMGRVWGPEAVAKSQSTAFYGNASALSESPKKDGLIYVGTDDGLIDVTEDGGANWRKVDAIPGAPPRSYVNRVLASQHDVNTVYALFDNHKEEDFKPYLMKSTDAGKTWTAIQNNLPANGPVWSIAEDPVEAKLLFVGTEFGLYFSNDGGEKWNRLKGGLPTTAISDMTIQPQMNDLVLATYGRSFYVLDDYSMLRELTPDLLAKPAALFGVRDALMFLPSQNLGGTGKAWQGEQFFTAPNPPYGATFTYYLKDALKTKKEKRIDAEHEAEKSGKTIPYPTADELRAEAEEPAPQIVLTVTDADGNVVRHITGPLTAGFHRVNWDLRYPAASLPSARQRGDDDGEGGPTGPLAMPGTYKVALAERVNGEWSDLGTPQTFQVVAEGVQQMSAEDRAALVAFQRKVARLQGAVSGSLEVAANVNERLTQIERALQATPAPDQKLIDDAQAIHRQLEDLLRALRGDEVLRSYEENTPPSISQRVGGIVYAERLSTAHPTQTQVDSYAIAGKEFVPVLAKLHQLVEVDLANLEKAMDQAGAPHTPGRLPNWKPE